MNIGLDLTWMSLQNQGGGVFQYGMRVLDALTGYTDHSVIAIVSEGCDALFEHLSDRENLRFIVGSSAPLASIVEREGIDVIHTPIQHHLKFTLAVPMITTLHDLQPFYFPEFFTPEEIEYRNLHYRKSAEFSERVIVSYRHVKDDLTKFYGIPPEKIDICGHGMAEAVPVSPEQIAVARRRYSLPEKYLFYSANTWRHKNHLGLLRALKLLHEKHGIKAPLVCTGVQYPDFFPEIEEEIARLGLDGSVTFLGYLPEEDMPAILCGATLSVIPTLYEAGSFPLMEAMNNGVPVICAATTSLPDTIGDRRFVFDPDSPDDMAEKMAMMLADERMRRENVANSALRVAEWRWDKAVKPFVACYQKAIDSFAEKTKSRWHSDWAMNYEFMSQKNESELRRELARAYAEKNEIAQQLGNVSSRVSSIEKSFSWRLTAPLRKLLDMIRS